MAADRQDGPSGEPESHNPESHGEVPQSNGRKIPGGNDFVHVVWIVLALLVFGLILSVASGDCSGNCGGNTGPLWH